MSKLDSIKSVIDLWPSRAALAGDLSVAGEVVAVDRVHKWAQRGDIPSPYWARLIEVATAKGLGPVTPELLVMLHDKQRSPEQKDSAA